MTYRSDIKPIETIYNGYRFRSRLEARWAVFLDALGIRWKYEFEGYELPNGEWYLPDFWLPTFNGGMFVEVKPEAFTPEEKEKCALLCELTHYSVWLADDVPQLKCYEVYYPNGDSLIEGDGIPNADQAERENRMFGMVGYLSAGEKVKPSDYSMVGNTFINAVKTAKQARFEHGENP